MQRAGGVRASVPGGTPAPAASLVHCQYVGLAPLVASVLTAVPISGFPAEASFGREGSST